LTPFCRINAYSGSTSAGTAAVRLSAPESITTIVLARSGETRRDPVGHAGQQALAPRGELALVVGRLRRNPHRRERETQAKHQTQAAAGRNCRA
jgi:hypothetical protein